MRFLVPLLLAITVIGSTEAVGTPSEAALNASTLSDPYNQAVTNFRNKPTQLLVGGQSARAGEFPWQVSLEVSFISDPHWAHFCGGTIYKSDWIVTAAHCVYGLQKDDILVAPGMLKLTSGVTRYELDRPPLIIRGYTKGKNDNDVALLHLRTALPQSYLIRSIDLVSDSMEATFSDQGSILTMSGWGANEPVGLTVDSLLRVDMPYVSLKQCTSSLSYPPDPDTHKPQVTSQMLCAGYKDGSADICEGDSGGPLVYFNNGRAVLVGVASWTTYPCATPYKYGVFSRLSQYRSWLEKSTKN